VSEKNVFKNKELNYTGDQKEKKKGKQGKKSAPGRDISARGGCPRGEEKTERKEDSSIGNVTTVLKRKNGEGAVSKRKKEKSGRTHT